MGFAMSCDRCGRFMKNLKPSALRSLRDDEIVCDECQKTEVLIRKRVEKIKRKAEGEFNKVLSGLKSQITKAIKAEVKSAVRPEPEG